MSNSPLVIHTNISPHRTSPRNHAIDTITIHCTAGQGSVETIGRIFQSREASSNYGIGSDGRIGMYVEECDRSWCSGGRDKQGKIITVNGISGGDNDHRAITIEVASDSTHPYEVNDTVYAALIDLCTDICQRNGIKELKWEADKSLVGQVDKQNMTVHRWFALKACPGDYLYNRHPKIAAEVNKRLNPVVTIQNGGEEVTKEEFRKMYLEMRKETQDNDSSAWSQQAREWAISTGLVQGGNEINGEPNYMWEDVLTREQMVMLLYRFTSIIGKA